MPRHNYVVETPSDSPTRSGSIDDVKRDFAQRLYRARIDKGWNQAELARAAAKFMADKKFGRDLIGPYERAERLPSPVHLAAMARALGKEPKELMVHQGVPGSDNRSATPVDVKDVGDGQAWIKINKQVPWDIALQVMKLMSLEAPKRG